MEKPAYLTNVENYLKYHFDVSIPEDKANDMAFAIVARLKDSRSFRAEMLEILKKDEPGAFENN